MKKLFLISLLALSGCAISRQYARTESTNPTNNVETTTVAKSTIFAWGDARILVEKTRASAGKTSSVGATGTSEEVSSTNIMNGAGGIIGQAVSTYMKSQGL